MMNNTHTRRLASAVARLAAVALTGAAVAGFVHLTDPAADQPAAATAATTVDTTDTGAGWACWVEWKNDTAAEVLEGDPANAPEDATPVPCVDAPQVQASLDRAAAEDARRAASPAEDSKGFDCRVNGNRTCGPTNRQHVTPGCYVDGQLDKAWTEEMYGRWFNCGVPSTHDRHMMALLGESVSQV